MTQKDLRDKDREVLRQIAKGNTDIQEITESTTLENHEVNYCFTKLEDLDLIQVEKPGGRVTRVVNGQKRNFQAPKQAELSEKGVQCLDEFEFGNRLDFKDLSHTELVDKVNDLEREVEELKQSFWLFKKQIQKKL